MCQGMLAGFDVDHSEPAYKNCSQCGLLLPLDRFQAKARNADGKMSHCRECERLRTLGRKRVIEGIAAELRCTRCQTVKSQSEFRPSGITSPASGLCKACAKERDAKANAIQKEKWQQKIDSGEVRQCRVCQTRKQIDAFQPNSLRCYACKTRNTNSKLKNRLRNARNRAMDRGLSFDLTLEEYAILVSAPCTYCGGPLPKTGSGLDRIENDKGYSRMNCIPCCDACNTARGARWSVEQMVKFIGPAIRQARESGGEVARVSFNRKPRTIEAATKPETWTVGRFASQFLTTEPKAKAVVLTAARAVGIGKDRTLDLLVASVSEGLAFVWWPATGHRVKHYANQPYDGRVGFDSSGPGEVPTRRHDTVRIS